MELELIELRDALLRRYESTYPEGGDYGDSQGRLDERLAMMSAEAGFSPHIDSETLTAANGAFKLSFADGGERRLVAGSLFMPRAVQAVRPGAFHEIVVPGEPA